MDWLLNDIELASLALAALVFAVTLGLGYREIQDRRGRPATLAPVDIEHYRQRDRRRSAGLSLLCIVALGIVVGARTPNRLAGRPNPTFLLIWLGIFALIVALLTLSLVDWVALNRYARRKKAAMSREHLDRIRAELDQRQGPDGRLEPH